MNRTPHRLVRPGFLLALLGAYGLFFVIGGLLPSLSGSSKAKLPQVTSNLRQIDLAKRLWALDHAATNGVAIPDVDLAEYLGRPPGSTGLVASIDSEVYSLNAVGTPPEARLEKALGSKFPKGTLVRWNADVGCEVLLPNPQGEANGWRPLYSGTNRIAAH